MEIEIFYSNKKLKFTLFKLFYRNKILENKKKNKKDQFKYNLYIYIYIYIYLNMLSIIKFSIQPQIYD